MFRTLALITLLFSIQAFNAHSQEKPKKINYLKEGYVKAKVIKYPVDGCGLLIELPDKEKTKLAPDKLPDHLKKHNRKVWLKYALVKKPLMNTCMAGKQVEVIDIRKR